MLFRVVMVLVAMLLSFPAFAAESASKTAFPVVQIQVFGPIVCENFYGFSVVAPRPQGNGGRDLFDCRGPSSDLPTSELVKTCDWVKGKMSGIKPCVPQTSVEAANAWMASEGGKIKILSVQVVERNFKGYASWNEVVMVTWEAPASQPILATAPTK